MSHDRPDQDVSDRGLLGRFGSAKRPGSAVTRAESDVDDATIDALGKLSEALEVVENARGLLYNFHRLCGTADLTLQEAVTMLREAGRTELADEIDEVLVGRNVIADRWSFQLVEDYDAGYWQVFRAVEAEARARVGGVAPHVFEARLKAKEQNAKNAESG
jgi:hypothetical protein